MMAAPDRVGHAVTLASDVTQAAEELRFRHGHQIDGSTFERAGLDFERGHDGATEPDTARQARGAQRTKMPVP
jgi:hypothetical protein